MNISISKESRKDKSKKMLEVKERTAKGYIRYMREKEIIEKEGDCYVHGQGRV